MSERVYERDGLFVYEVDHRIVYNTKKPVPISEVIAALQGLEGILRSVPQVVSGLTGVEIDHSAFNLQAIESGSLIEDIVVQFVFGDRAKLDAFIAKAGGNAKVKGTVIAVAIAGVVGYGLHWATAKAPQPAPNITANNNVIITIGASEMQMTPEQFSAIVRGAVESKKDAAQNAIKLMAPARSDPTSSVDLNAKAEAGGPKLQIPPAAIAETPKRLDLPRNERTMDIPNAVVEIRASDRDSKKTGWAGKIEGATDRVRIELDPAVSEAEMFGKSQVTADVTLIYEPRGKGETLKPAKIYIRRIH